MGLFPEANGGKGVERACRWSGLKGVGQIRWLWEEGSDKGRREQTDQSFPQEQR